MNCYRFAIVDRESGILVNEWFVASVSLTNKEFRKVFTKLYLWQRFLDSNWVMCRIYRNGELYYDIASFRENNGLRIMLNLQTIRFIHI